MTDDTKVEQKRQALPPVRRIVEPNYTQYPNVVLDHLMAQLSGAEFKVLSYIVRHTFGWRKPSDAISLTQMGSGLCRPDGTVVDRGTGLSRPTIVTAIRSLQERGLLVATTNADDAGGYDATRYRLVIADEAPK